MKEALRAIASGCYHNTYISPCWSVFHLKHCSLKDANQYCQWSTMTHTQSSNSSMQIKLYQDFIDSFFSSSRLTSFSSSSKCEWYSKDWQISVGRVIFHSSIKSSLCFLSHHLFTPTINMWNDLNLRGIPNQLCKGWYDFPHLSLGFHPFTAWNTSGLNKRHFVHHSFVTSPSKRQQQQKCYCNYWSCLFLVDHRHNTYST